jgi:hypothetical protein
MVAVLGAAPVTFISEDTEPGTQFQIPLGLLSISAGVVDASAWKPPAALKPNDVKVLKALLADLLARGVIAPPSA